MTVRAPTDSELSSLHTLPWQVQRPFVATIEVGPEHMDEFEHTNNVVYLSWMQDVATLHSAFRGLSFTDYVRLGTGCVARRHEINYVLPTFVGDVLLAGTWVRANDGRTDMWRAYQFIRASDHKTVIHGQTQWVCIDMKTGRPKRQPKEFIEAYAPHEPAPL